MLRVCINGAGDIKYHYNGLLKIPEKKLEREIDGIAKTLSDCNVEIVMLPDRGVPFEIAKRYKAFGGKKVYATVPISDKDFGIRHLEPYINAKVNGKKVVDKVIDTENWYKQDLTYCTFGDIVLMLGNSLGAMGELCYGFYLYKLFSGGKPGVNPIKNKIHKEIRAGEKIPFTVIIYKPFVKGKLNFEIEQYIKKFNGKVYYTKSINDLKSILKKLE